MNGQFQRGREVYQANVDRRRLRAEGPPQLQSAIIVLAVHNATKKQRIVGVALTQAGVAELTAMVGHEFADCQFTMLDTQVILR